MAFPCMGVTRLRSQRGSTSSAKPGVPRCTVPRPKLGADRLQKQIAAIKTFWDVSSNLRARRLYWMFQDNFSEPTGSATANPPDAAAKDEPA